MASKKYISKIRNLNNLPVPSFGLLSWILIILGVVVFGIPFYKKMKLTADAKAIVDASGNFGVKDTEAVIPKTVTKAEIETALKKSPVKLTHDDYWYKKSCDTIQEACNKYEFYEQDQKAIPKILNACNGPDLLKLYTTFGTRTIYKFYFVPFSGDLFYFFKELCTKEVYQYARERYAKAAIYF